MTSLEKSRQFDISKQWNFHTSLPIAIPYRLDATDYVFFNIPNNFNVEDYSVVVESASNASPNPADRFRLIGPLQQKVELPNVYYSRGFGSQASIGVLPNNNTNLDPFISNLVRGATYTINPNAPFVTPTHRGMARLGGLV
jgi:hypothetical protein